MSRGPSVRRTKTAGCFLGAASAAREPVEERPGCFGEELGSGRFLRDREQLPSEVGEIDLTGDLYPAPTMFQRITFRLRLDLASDDGSGGSA